LASVARAHLVNLVGHHGLLPGVAAAEHLPPGDLGVPEAGPLLGMPVDRAQQRVDVEVGLLLDPKRSPIRLIGAVQRPRRCQDRPA
jgi:hypothetical protein